MFLPDPDRPDIRNIRKAFDNLRIALESIQPGPCRARSLMKTKIDEAQLWAYQLLDPQRDA